LAVARQWVGAASGSDIAKEGMSEKIHVLTATPHASAVKSLALLGMGSSNITTIKTMRGNREAIDNTDLEAKINALAGQPFILISSAGTVNTVDFDDFEGIAALRKKHHFWWHIDAAFGGFAACSPKYQHLLSGWQGTDSITVDAHKWLNVPYESAFFFLKKAHKILQAECFQNSNAPYLGNGETDFGYLNFLPENSRRLKALPIWFSLRAYGKQGFQNIVENSVEMAELFGNFIDKSPDFELLAPVRLNTVCFTLRKNDENSLNFLTKLNARQRVYMTPTVYAGKKGIRAAFVNWRTTAEDIAIAITEMQAVLSNDAY
jgi:glutamate/tyrosine decarboxylase-like PLP-dependent enzyme